MAKYGGSSVGFLLADQFSLLPSTITGITGPDIESVLEDVTGLGDTWAQHLASGLRKAAVGVDGLYDDLTTGLAKSLEGAENTSRVLSFTIHGNSYGAKATCAAGAFGSKWSRVAQIGGLTKARAQYAVSGAVDDDAVILFPLGAITADTNTEGANSQDHGASTAGGYAAYLHVTAYSGFTSVGVTVRHSVDDVTYADLATFASVTAVGAQAINGVGTVNRHTAVNLDVTGSGSITLAVMLKRR
jgi:hypothetical protein